MSNKPTKAELKELQQLKLQLNLQQKKIHAQNEKLKKEKVKIETENKKITIERRELEKARLRFEKDKTLQEKQLSAHSIRNTRSSSSSSSLHKNIKSTQQFMEITRKYEKECKKSLDLQKKLDATAAQNNVLMIKVKNLSESLKKKREDETDPRLRQLNIENRDLRKKLRTMFNTINSEKRYYIRSIQIFKENQNKWIEKQRALFKDKKMIIKYVFLDDIKYIKQYKKTPIGSNKLEFKNKVTFKMRNGAETTKKGVEIIVSDEKQDENDEELMEDKLVDELMEEFKTNDIMEENIQENMETNMEENMHMHMKENINIGVGQGQGLLSQSATEEVDENDEVAELQKRLDELQKQIESKDLMIGEMKSNFKVRKENQEEFKDEHSAQQRKQMKKKRVRNKLNIVISQKLDVIKQEVNLGSVVHDSPFKMEDSKSKKLEKELKKKANPLKTEISLLKNEVQKLKRENTSLKLLVVENNDENEK